MRIGSADFVEDLLAHEVGERDLGGGDEPEAISRDEQVLGELRQVAGAVGGMVLDQQWRVVLGVTAELAVRGRCVQVEHEGGDGALEPRQRALEHDEAGPRDFRRGLEVHEAQGLADLEVLLGLEAELRRRADLSHLDVVVGAGANRHVGKRQVRDDGESIHERLVELTFLLGSRSDDLFQLGDLGHKLGGRRLVLRRLRLANLLRGGVAARLRLLQLRHVAAARLVELNKPRPRRVRARGSPSPCRRRRGCP